VNVNEGDKKGNVERWLLEVQDSMIKTLTKAASGPPPGPPPVPFLKDLGRIDRWVWINTYENTITIVGYSHPFMYQLF